MSTKAFVIVLVIVSFGLIGAYAWNMSEPEEMPRAETNDTAENTAGMRAEENAVVVNEQKPGTAVIGSLVYLASPGYLVIHEDRNGEPGAILGASALLSAGEHTNVAVTLSRAARDGETLHAMLHAEMGGNAKFSAAEDTPVQSRLGGPISGWFVISIDATGPVPVAI